MGKVLGSLRLMYSGKGKDMWELPGHPEHLLQVARNTLSTHNVVHLSEVPGKGELINSLSLYMLNVFPEEIETHIVAFGRAIFDYLPGDETDYPRDLCFRSVVVHRLAITPIEFIKRSYLVGSLYKAYMEGKDPYGLNLPSGLPLMHAFPKPISTPTEKSATDDPRNFQEIAELYPVETDITDIVYKTGSDFLLTKGIRLIDGKSEASGFMLADDWLNGDCCRMARVEDIQEGIEPPFLDKENFRKTALRKWNGGPKVPLTFNQAETRDGLAGYHQAFEMITGQSISDFRRKFYS